MNIDNFRLKAFLIHLVLSIVLIIICAYLIFYIWYPNPLAKAVGVTNIFFIMSTVLVVLGPLMTLLFIKKNKKTLKFDLIIIVLIQLVAFIYGMYTIATTRPVYIAFDISRFDLVQANNLSTELLSDALPPFNQINWSKPKLVAVTVAKDNKELSDRISYELDTGITGSMQPNLYESLNNQWKYLNKVGKPLSELSQYNHQDKIDNILTRYPETDKWLPLRTQNLDMVVLLDSKNQKIVRIVDLRPWKTGN